MSEFSRSPYITIKRRGYLSEKLGITEREVGAWFDQRRYLLRSHKVQINWHGNQHHYSPVFICHFICLAVSLS